MREDESPKITEESTNSQKIERDSPPHTNYDIRSLRNVFNIKINKKGRKEVGESLDPVTYLVQFLARYTGPSLA